jgi:predicted  nucleic acid-binding Zn-ribbon protein
MALYFKRTMLMALGAATVALGSLSAHALERTAVGNRNTQAVSAFKMQLEAQRAAVETAVNDIIKRVAILEDRADATDVTLEDLDGRLDLAESQLISLTGRVTHLEARVTALENDLASLRSQLLALMARMDTAESNISSLKSFVNTHTAQIAALQSTTSNHASRISTAEAEINALKARVSALENKILGLVPTGTIAMFSTNYCPTGWSAVSSIRDRVPVGAQGSYYPGTTGGQNSVTLSVANLPNHTHPFSAYSNDVFVRQADGSGQPLYHQRSYSSNTSGCSGCSNAPFDNRQPFIALTFCSKN